MSVKWKYILIHTNIIPQDMKYKVCGNNCVPDDPVNDVCNKS